MPENDEMVTCPKGHTSRLSQVIRLMKSHIPGDEGTLECPVPFCKCTWCNCQKHGVYPCPPPCKMGPH